MKEYLSKVNNVVAIALLCAAFVVSASSIFSTTGEAKIKARICNPVEMPHQMHLAKNSSGATQI